MFALIGRLNACKYVSASLVGRGAGNGRWQSGVANPEHFDIVISGGGMVGTSMACALGFHLCVFSNQTIFTNLLIINLYKGSDKLFKNLKIALIESSPQRGEYKSPAIHHNRVCALSNKTIDFFKSIGSFDFIESNRFGNVHHMHVKTESIFRFMCL